MDKKEVSMSQLLLDTVSRNKNLQSYFLTVQSSTNKSSNNVEAVKPQKKDTDDFNMLTAGLTGLGIIGAAILGVKAGKYYRKQKILTEIQGLKSEIKDAYDIAKASMIQELVDEGLPKSFNSGKFYNHKIKSSRDIQAVGDYYRSVYATLERVQKESSESIRESIKRVSPDPEWQELHRYRKQLVKETNGKDLNKQEIALKKISLVNDMLVYKLHPELKDMFQTRNLISVEDAKMLLKKDFLTKEDYENEYQKHIQFEFSYNPMVKFFVNSGELSLLDLFKYEITSHKIAGDKMKLAKLVFDEDVVQVQSRYSEKLKALAEDFSKNEKVIRLKALVSSKALS